MKLGFLSEQTKKKTQISQEPKEKTEVDIAVEKCGKNFYSVIKDMLIRFEFIDVEHIEKAFKTTLKKIEDERIDNLEEKK